MFDHLLGILLLGLGLTHPINPNVKGDSTEVSNSQGSGSSAGVNDDSGHSGTGTSGRTETEHATDTPRPTKLPESHDVLTRQQVLTNIREHEIKLQEVFDTRKARQEKELQENQARAKLNTDTARKSFTTKLAKLKDEKKKAIAVSIDLKITELNKKRTTILLAFVTKMQEVLDKISTRAAEAAKAGKDVSKVDSAVTAAQATVATALTAVTTQSGKTYVASVTSDETLKTDMETITKLLKNDLDRVNALVDAARKAVYLAYTELAHVMEEPVAAPSATTP
jgi:hypothetical protein